MSDIVQGELISAESCHKVSELKLSTVNLTPKGRICWWVLERILSRLSELLFIRSVAGVENLPKNSSYILAANHSSYLDSMFLISSTRVYMRFIVKSAYYNHWLWHKPIVSMGQLGIDGSFRNGVRALREGNIIAIFPEGTRTRDGQLGKGNKGVAAMARKAGVPIVPVGIKGALRVWPSQNRWPKIFFPKIVDVKIGEPIYLADNLSDSDEDVANAVMKSIGALIE